jgi:hypothetical protein
MLPYWRAMTLLLRHIQIVHVTYGAGASVAFAIGLASAEFATMLTLKAVIPFSRELEFSGMYAIFGKNSHTT